MPHFRHLDDLESTTWVDEGSLLRQRWILALILIAVVMCILVIVLPSLDRIITDPDARWAVLVVVVVAIGIVVLRQAAMAESPVVMERSGRERERSRGKLERLEESIQGGRDGSGYSQMLAVLELRSAFRGKVMSLRGLSREEYNNLYGDVDSLRRLVGDQELHALLTMNLRESFDSGRGMEGRRFMEYMERMVRKMERWT